MFVDNFPFCFRGASGQLLQICKEIATLPARQVAQPITSAYLVPNLNLDLAPNQPDHDKFFRSHSLHPNTRLQTTSSRSTLAYKE
jgi:hypothetical protein